MTNPYAIGRRVYLRAPTAEDAAGRWHEWFSDPETTQYMSDRYWPNTPERQKEFLDGLQRSQASLVLSILEKDTNELIGVCSLGAINWVHRYADFAVVIGERKYRNGQIALEVVSLLLETAFLRLNLLNVKGGFMESNGLTEAILKIFGFDVIGRFKGLCFHKGTYVDLVCVQLNRETWLRRNRERTSAGRQEPVGS